MLSLRFKGLLSCPGHYFAEKQVKNRRDRLGQRTVQDWDQRTKTVLSSPDNAFIARVPDAGKVIDDTQIMHNGLKIKLGSYCGDENTTLIQANQGVHEPEEERAYAAVLKLMPPGAAIIELGSYWAYYSAWFCKSVPDARAIMVEPVKDFMALGQANFNLNNLTGTFINAFVSDHPITASPTPTVCVDQLMAEHNLDFLHLLHSDIQGYETAMLKGAHKALAQGSIGYLFISTHSDRKHIRCINTLKRHGYHILAQADLDQTHSVDGLIVAKRADMPGPDHIEISHRT